MKQLSVEEIQVLSEYYFSDFPSLAYLLSDLHSFSNNQAYVTQLNSINRNFTSKSNEIQTK